MREFVYTGKDVNIKQAMQSNIAGMGKGLCDRLLREREVRVNGVRVAASCVVRQGDVVRVYFKEEQIAPQIVYIDSNIIVVNKRAGMETCDGEGNLLQLQQSLYGEVYAVHRLDANTTGLVIFARNPQAERQLLAAIKQRKIKKYYRAAVVGVPDFKNVANATIVNGYYQLTAYLVKDAKKARVAVYQNFVQGSKKIVTLFRVDEVHSGNAVLSVLLQSGATHQIRAHLAFIGHPVIGDDLYGSREANKAAGKRVQQLSAVKIEMDGLSNELESLNGKVFVLDKQ